jgi:uncharacterized repeat protein (TIGR03803 family)
MTSPIAISSSALRTSLRKTAVTGLLVYTLTVLAGTTTQAQTFEVIHSFARVPLGFAPHGGLVQDARGDLYGTTNNGGGSGSGSVYKLTDGQSGWIMTALVVFEHDGNGYSPEARLTLGPDGAFYGTTMFGGYPGGCGGSGCGTIFRLNPAGLGRTVLYRFSDQHESYWPYGALSFDSAGNMYGTTGVGGTVGNGTVFKLVRSGNQWNYSVIYNFEDASKGWAPEAGVIVDSAGNLYGTTVNGGGTSSYGVVYELSPSAGGWSSRVLHSFSAGYNDGGWPEASLIMDAAGNLYGTTSGGGTGYGGTVFELSPSGNNWNYRTICNLATAGDGTGGPWDGVLMDAAGNLYGTTYDEGAYGQGSVFKVVQSNGDWSCYTIHDFNSPNDGANPIGDLMLDAHGNVFGTAWTGGPYGGGTAWEVTP